MAKADTPKVLQSSAVVRQEAAELEGESAGAETGARSGLALEPPITDFLARGYEDYLRLVRRAAAHPENRDGADKTWVERGMWDFEQHYRKAVRRP